MVGRAFMRALRQEFAGRSRAAAPGVGMPPRVRSVPALPCLGLGIAQHPHPLPQGNPLLPVPRGCAQRGPLTGLSQGDSHNLSPGAGPMELQLELGSRQPSQAPAQIWHCCQAPRPPGSPKGQSRDGPPRHGSPSPALLASACLQPSSLWAPTANRCPPPPPPVRLIRVTPVGWRQHEEGRVVKLGSEHLGACGLCCPPPPKAWGSRGGRQHWGGLTPSVSPSSKPSGGRRARALREAPVRRCLQDHWHQPPGSSADPQRFKPQPGGDPEGRGSLGSGERWCWQGPALPTAAAQHGGDNWSPKGVWVLSWAQLIPV